MRLKVNSAALLEALVDKGWSVTKAAMEMGDAAKVALIDEICAVEMSANERKVLMLRYVACMNFRDICFEMNIKEELTCRKL